jgi:hypothetical protein
VVSTDAAKPKVDPQTEAEYVRYARSCGCGRQLFNGKYRSVCVKMTRELCSRKNVQCALIGSKDEWIARFTDDAGKVIGMGDNCAKRIDGM